MSVTDAVQVAVIQHLKADATLTGMVGGRIYDRVPTDAVHPYISWGPEDWVKQRGDCLAAVDGTIQIDVWSREVGRREVRRIMDRVAALMDDALLVLAPPARAVLTEVGIRRVLMEPDGLTAHGVVPVSIMAEETD